MGDPRRFDLFSKLIERAHPAREMSIADVASGKGALQAALRQRGYRSVISWDTRKRNAKTRPCYRFGKFDHRNAPRGYDLVIGMHPDQATDQIIAYAAKHRVPFVVCPCCLLPTASTFWGPHTFSGWVDHLIEFARAGRMKVEMESLPMVGRNVVLLGVPG